MVKSKIDVLKEKLRQCEKKFNSLFEASWDALFLVDARTGKVIDCNQAACELVGREKEELIGKPFKFLHPVEVLGHTKEKLLSIKLQDVDAQTDPDKINHPLLNMPSDEIQEFETIQLTKQGKKIPVEVSSSSINYKGKPAILSIARNITPRKQKEKEINKKSDELKRLNEKLEVVGRLTRHDVRNKLSTVVTNLYLAKKKLGDQHEAVDYLEDIQTAVDQATKIFYFVKIYEQLGTQELDPVDGEEAVEDAIQQISDLKGVEVKNQCKGLTVLADPMLPRLFYNLIHNSLQHGGEELSRITVDCRPEEPDGIKVVYEDDGVGIPEEEKEKIFREGYGRGTGYGLYLIREMCEVYGWTIKESGQPGQGVKFTITIPQKAMRETESS